MATPKNYTSLPGRGGHTNFVTRTGARLYAGTDHLLSVEKNYWVENYRRYYYADIQALVITKTRNALIWNLILALITLGFAGGAFAIQQDAGSWTTEAIALLVIAGFVGVFLLFGLLRGPSCKATIQTAIGVDPLPALKRLRAAKKCVAAIKSRVEQVQGAIAPAELPATLTAAAQLTSAPPASASSNAKTHYRGGMHRALFIVTFIAAATALANTVIMNAYLELALFALLLIAVVFIILAVVRQNPQTPKSIRVLTWLELALAALYFCGAFVLYFVAAIQFPELVENNWELWRNGLQLALPVLFWTDLIMGILLIAIAIPGFIIAWRMKREANSLIG